MSGGSQFFIPDLKHLLQSIFVKMPPTARGTSPVTDIVNGVNPNFNYANIIAKLPYLTLRTASSLQYMFLQDMTLCH